MYPISINQEGMSKKFSRIISTFVFYRWLMENYEQDPLYATNYKSCEMYNEYVNYCKKRGYEPMSMPVFGKKIRVVFPNIIKHVKLLARKRIKGKYKYQKIIYYTGIRKINEDSKQELCIDNSRKEVGVTNIPLSISITDKSNAIDIMENHPIQSTSLPAIPNNVVSADLSIIPGTRTSYTPFFDHPKIENGFVPNHTDYSVGNSYIYSDLSSNPYYKYFTSVAAISYNEDIDYKCNDKGTDGYFNPFNDLTI
jgi:hypothetical protein